MRQLFYYNLRQLFYYKMRRLLQNASVHTTNANLITKKDEFAGNVLPNI